MDPHPCLASLAFRASHMHCLQAENIGVCHLRGSINSKPATGPDVIQSLLQSQELPTIKMCPSFWEPPFKMVHSLKLVAAAEGYEKSLQIWATITHRRALRPGEGSEVETSLYKVRAFSGVEEK